MPLIITNYKFALVCQQGMSSAYNRFQVVQTKFNKNTIKQLLQILVTVDWNQSVGKICEELNNTSNSQFQNKYAWMVGTNPSYFIQYQIDSYAIFKGYSKVVLVWKPKYLQYPSLIKLSDFGQQPKIPKSLLVTTEQKKGNLSEQSISQLSQFIKMFYGLHFFNLPESTFQSNLLTQTKHYISRICKQSYWHCGIDNHQTIDVSSKNVYLRLRIKGIRDKYDKDIILFSQKGNRQFALRGKGMQVVSFIAMLLIFVAVISCSKDDKQGVCFYRDQMILGSAGVMLALMGMRFVNRNKMKKKLDKKIEQLDKKD